MRQTPWWIAIKRHIERQTTMRRELAAALWEIRTLEREKLFYINESDAYATQLERLRRKCANKKENICAKPDACGDGNALEHDCR